MKTLIETNTATNAMEAKVITDSFLSSLTDEYCFKLLSVATLYDRLWQMPSQISYAIGASAYYYGAECKVFCSEEIRVNIYNRAYKHIKAINQSLLYQIISNQKEL